MATIDMEQLDGVVGCFCTLLYPRRGQTEGTIFSLSVQELPE